VRTKYTNAFLFSLKDQQWVEDWVSSNMTGDANTISINKIHTEFCNYLAAKVDEHSGLPLNLLPPNPAELRAWLTDKLKYKVRKPSGWTAEQDRYLLDAIVSLFRETGKDPLDPKKRLAPALLLFDLYQVVLTEKGLSDEGHSMGAVSTRASKMRKRILKSGDTSSLLLTFGEREELPSPEEAKASSKELEEKPTEEGALKENLPIFKHTQYGWAVNGRLLSDPAKPNHYVVEVRFPDAKYVVDALVSVGVRLLEILGKDTPPSKGSLSKAPSVPRERPPERPRGETRA